MTSITEMLAQKITIHTDADLTPAGKRRIKIVKHHKSGKKIQPTMAWYVGNKLFRYLPLTTENVALSAMWVWKS